MSQRKPEQTGTAAARLGSMMTLCALLVGAGYGMRTVYRAATDSFVAPITLSPDNDAVISSKLRLSELYAERARMVAERDRIEAELVASSSAVSRLQELHSVAEGALDWTVAITTEADRAGQDDLRELENRERHLQDIQVKQKALVSEMEKNVEAGLVTKADYVRETMALSQVQLAVVDTARARLATRLQLSQARLAQRALSKTGNSSAPMMPEMIAQRSQSVHLELEILKLRAEQEALRAKKSVALQEIAKIDELTAEMRARPLYRAVEERLELAFVPYTQMDGVIPGAEVHECIWGLFGCEAVGLVSELLPGEVVMPDPWGVQARGQYAVLKLAESNAAKAKILRVRGRESTPDALQASTRTNR